MGFRSRGLAAFGAAGVVVAAAASPVGAAGGVSIRITKPLPSVIRVNQLVTVAGIVRGAPAKSTVALEVRRPGSALGVGKTLGTGRFEVKWRVNRPAYVQATWRIVVASNQGKTLAATAPKNVAIGPAAVYCKPPAPPAVNIPVGSGWIVGGLYGEGGPFPGIYACSSRPYTVTATNKAGNVVATQRVAALHSYTLVVPAGRYTLASGGCHGTATVTAGKQTKANTYCLYP